MKNIIPFKKDVIFKTNLSEITSISLENTLSLDKDKITGDFIVSGEYKISDTSTTVEQFTLNLPFEIVMDERFDTKKATIDIDDFYYEIVNNNVLSISIDVLIDKLEEKPLIDLDDLVDVEPVRDIIDSEEDNMESENFDIREIEKTNILTEEKEFENKLVEEIVEEKEEIRDIGEEREETKDTVEEKQDVIRKNDFEKEIVEEKINSLFNQFSSDSEVYVTYNVFILRDGDNLDSIMEKYGVTEETLKKYNDLSNLKIGDKLIIPSPQTDSYERN